MHYPFDVVEAWKLSPRVILRHELAVAELVRGADDVEAFFEVGLELCAVHAHLTAP